MFTQKNVSKMLYYSQQNKRKFRMFEHYDAFYLKSYFNIPMLLNILNDHLPICINCKKVSLNQIPNEVLKNNNRMQKL